VAPLVLPEPMRAQMQQPIVQLAHLAHGCPEGFRCAVEEACAITKAPENKIAPAFFGLGGSLKFCHSQSLPPPISSMASMAALY
jgi:hypothetical protein